MKKIFLHGGLLAVILTFFAACSDDDNTKPLAFPSDTLMATVGNTVYLAVESGSGDCTVVSADEAVVTARYEKTGNYISLMGYKEGKTTVKVTDNITDESVTLTVYVTRPYCALYMELSGTAITFGPGIESGYGSEPMDELEAQLKEEYSGPDGEINYSFYLLKGTEEVYIREIQGVSSIARYYSGKYQLTREGEDYRLTIRFDDSASVIEKEYTVVGDPRNDGYRAFRLFDEFFEGGSVIFQSETRAMLNSGVFFPPLLVREDLTAKYKEIYPDLIYAGLDLSSQLGFNNSMSHELLEELLYRD